MEKMRLSAHVEHRLPGKTPCGPLPYLAIELAERRIAVEPKGSRSSCQSDEADGVGLHRRTVYRRGLSVWLCDKRLQKVAL